MEFINATRQYKILEDGSHRVESYAQWENYFLKYVVVFVSKSTTVPISPKLVHQFVSLGQQNVTESGVTVTFMPNPTGPPFYNLTPKSKPQHRIMMDSGTFDHCGLFEPSPSSFCNKQEPDQFSLAQKEFSNIFTNLTKTYVSWSRNKEVDMQLLVQCDLYDLRSTEFFKSRNGKTWMSERTMTRKMARELEHLIEGANRHYKGVRWRPERKHPWVAEIKLPKKKKMWIGNFDTPEEAARAYDVAAICHGKKTRLNFGDFCKPISKPTMQHSLLSPKQRTEDLSFKILTQSDGSCQNTPECLVPALQVRMVSEYFATSDVCSTSTRVMEISNSAESSDSRGYTVVSEMSSTLELTGQPPLEKYLLTDEDHCSSNQVIEINESVNLESRATVLEKFPTQESVDQPPLTIETYENDDLSGIKSYAMFSNDLPSTENYSFVSQGTDISFPSTSSGLYPNEILSDLNFEELDSGVDLTTKEIGLCPPLEDYELDPKTSDLKVFEDLQEENFFLQLWEA